MYIKTVQFGDTEITAIDSEGEQYVFDYKEFQDYRNEGAYPPEYRMPSKSSEWEWDDLDENLKIDIKAFIHSEFCFAVRFSRAV